MSKNLTVVGIDPNSHKLALVWKRSGSEKPFIKTHELGSEHSARCGAAFRFMGEFLYAVKEDTGVYPILYMELPIMGVGGPGATIPQAFVQGAVMAAAEEFSCKIYGVNNQTWKKRVMGAGNISKEEVTKRMKKVWPELHAKASTDQDVIDAGAIYLFGMKSESLKASLRSRRIKR